MTGTSSLFFIFKNIFYFLFFFEIRKKKKIPTSQLAVFSLPGTQETIFYLRVAFVLKLLFLAVSLLCQTCHIDKRMPLCKHLSVHLYRAPQGTITHEGLGVFSS